MQKNDKRYLFESMPVPKAIAQMAIPTIISQLINLIYNVVDTFFIGRTGNSYMVADVTVAYTIYMMTVSFGNLFGVGGGSLTARLAGKQNYDGANRVTFLQLLWRYRDSSYIFSAHRCFLRAAPQTFRSE